MQDHAESLRAIAAHSNSTGIVCLLEAETGHFSLCALRTSLGLQPAGGRGTGHLPTSQAGSGRGQYGLFLPGTHAGPLCCCLPVLCLETKFHIAHASVKFIIQLGLALNFRSCYLYL